MTSSKSQDGLVESVPESAKILGVRFDFTDYAEAVKTICRWRAEGGRHYVCVTNPHSVMVCRRDRDMGLATAGASLIVPDGVGVIWAANILGFRHRGRVTGPTLMLRCCDWGREHGLRHFFYGGKEGVADRLAARLSEIYPGLSVAGTYCPPFRQATDDEDHAMVERVNATRPDVVWVGLGAPKQEKWMLAHAGKIDAAAMIGVGAAFDFHSGEVRWAPAWIRSLGLEWAYRLALEPKRMWRRNLDNAMFGAKVILQRCGWRF